jgi:prophage regulatory protein
VNYELGKLHMRKLDILSPEMKAPGKTLINRKQLLNKVPLSERTILDMEKIGKFPRRFALTPRMVVWDLDEIDKWMEQRKSAAQQCPAPLLKTLRID